MRTYSFLLLVSVACSYALTLWLARTALERGWARRQGDAGNSEGVPRLGGASVFLAMLLAIVLLLLWDNQVARRLALWPQGFALLGAATAVFLLGIYDDLRGVRPWQKLAVQAGAGLCLYAGGFRVELLTNPFTHGSVELGWLSLPVTLLWLVAISNAFNLIDGLDGLAAGVGLFATLSLFLVAMLAGRSFEAAVAAALAGALLGFLPHNFSPARIYLGDSGSLTMGLTLAALAVRSSQKGPVLITVAIPLMIFGLPLLDVGVTTLRRFLSGHPLFHRDEEHLHHRLVKRGLTHRRAVLILYSVAGLFALASLLLLNYQNTVALPIALLCGVLAWLVVRQMDYPEFAELNSHLRTTLWGQRAILRNSIMLRKAEAELRVASSVDDAWMVAVPIFSALEFDRARCEIRSGMSVDGYELHWVGQEDLGRQAQRGEEYWKLSIPLFYGGAQIGLLELSRAMDRGPLLFRVSSLLKFANGSWADRIGQLLGEEWKERASLVQAAS